MEEATTTETPVSQVQIDEMNRTVTLLAELTAAALTRGSDSWRVLGKVGMDLDHVRGALTGSGMAPVPTPQEG